VSCAADCGACPDVGCPTSPPPGKYVDAASGVDAAAGGTSVAPWRTLAYAVPRLAPGDTLYLRGGSYRESVVVSGSGTAAAPITIAGYPCERAIIDPAVPEFRTAGNADWELVDASLGEYRSLKTYSGSNGYIVAYVLGLPGYENERMRLVPYVSAAAFRATSEEYVDGSTPFYIGPGIFKDPDGRIHIRLAKTADLRAVEQRYGTLFATDRPDPRSHAILLSAAASAVELRGSYLTLRNLTLNQGHETIRLAGSYLRLEDLTVWSGYYAVRTAAAGVHHVTILRSRIYSDQPRWIFWSDMKDPPAPADWLRQTIVDLRQGAHDWEIAYSHIRGSGQDLVGVNDDEYNLVVHHSRLENCGDDAFELEGTTNVGRIEIYENYIGNCLTAVAPGQDTPQFDGPLLFYRNVVAFMRNPPINRQAGINTWNFGGGDRFGYEYMFKHGSGSSYSTQNTHYYQNTLLMLNHSGKGLNLRPKYPADTILANNLLVMVNGRVNESYQTGAGQVVDGNLYWKVNTVDTDALLASYDTVPAFASATGFETHGLGSVARRGTDPRFATLGLGFADRSQEVWEPLATGEVFGPRDFTLAADSPALGAGIALPAHPVLGLLPDTRSSHDPGAIPGGAAAASYEIFPFVPTLPGGGY
jgi:hypothetical protein